MSSLCGRVCGKTNGMEEKNVEGLAQADSVQDEIAENQPPRLTDEKQISAASPFSQRFRKISVHSDTKQLTDWINNTVGSESYGATRVFDLFTLLAVTVGFAVLFALLKLAEPIFEEHLPQVYLACASYIVLIAVAQQWSFGGKKPRLASILCGPIAYFILSLGFLLNRQIMGTVYLFPLQLMLSLVCSLPLGIFLGYVAGGAIAGVFLLADKLRNYWKRSETPVSEGTDSMWDSEG